MVKKKTLLKTSAAFGAAIATMYAAPELNADIAAISFSPSSVPFFPTTSALANVQMSTGGGNIGSFSQWNDNIGQTMFFNSGIASWTQVQYSQTLNPTTFVGANFNIVVTTGYVGFRSLSGNVGFFNINLGGGVGGTITYSGGFYGNAGESVHVGVIPEPATTAGLAVLALGAAGIRRRRSS